MAKRKWNFRFRTNTYLRYSKWDVFSSKTDICTNLRTFVILTNIRHITKGKTSKQSRTTRLHELASAARGGIMQPKTYFFGQLCTGWGGHLSRRFCNMFSNSSPCLPWAAWQLQYSPPAWDTLRKKSLQNLQNKWPPHPVRPTQYAIAGRACGSGSWPSSLRSWLYTTSQKLICCCSWFRTAQAQSTILLLS